jgi:uncharacterized protein YbaR (Trm112 family)
MDNTTARRLGDIALPDWTLEYLRCPRSGGKLVLACQSVFDTLQVRANSETLFTVLGRTISSVPSQGLVSEDGRWFYTVRDSIADLMADEATDLSSWDNGSTL